MAKGKILVVDDDEDISNLVEVYLLREGYQVFTAGNGVAALQAVKDYKPDLIILDIMLPEMDGLDVCRKLRQDNDTPILFISARGADDDKTEALNIGGDDYMTKPFSPKELVARVKARLRRPFVRDTKVHNIQKFEGLEIDQAAHVVRINGQGIMLSGKELKLLVYLANNANIVVTTDDLFAALWDSNRSDDKRTVIVHLSNMRKKFEAIPACPKIIQTIRGVGYKFLPAPL